MIDPKGINTEYIGLMKCNLCARKKKPTSATSSPARIGKLLQVNAQLLFFVSTAAMAFTGWPLSFFGFAEAVASPRTCLRIDNFGVLLYVLFIPAFAANVLEKLPGLHPFPALT